MKFAGTVATAAGRGWEKGTTRSVSGFWNIVEEQEKKGPIDATHQAVRVLQRCGLWLTVETGPLASGTGPSQTQRPRDGSAAAAVLGRLPIG